MSDLNLVLWGHSLQDYREMFNLTPEDCDKFIIDCAPGPASFCAEMTADHKRVIACDSLYALSSDALHTQVDDTFQATLAKVKTHESEFVWESISSVDELAERRLSGIHRFMKDYEQGRAERRYLPNPLIKLPFTDAQFQLALCSHALFGHRRDAELAEHQQIVEELCRVAEEVRIFPLLDNNGELSPLVGPLVLLLQQANYGVEILEVDYQFQKMGNAMLKITAKECLV